MLKKVRWLLILCILSIGVHTAAAQNAPPQINLALQDLGQRVGQPVTLAHMMLWTWSGEWYPDASLGCPQPGQAYAQVSTPGFRFTFKFLGNTYDYRVAADSSALILCSVTPAPTAVIATAPPALPALPAVPAAACAITPPLPLTEGMQARTAPGMASNLNLRAAPTLAGPRIGLVPPGQVFTILGGPVCAADGLHWWQIEHGALTGWIAQGQAGINFVELLPEPLPPVAEQARIARNNLSLLAEQARVEGALGAGLAWSPDDTWLAVISTDAAAPGVWLYALPLNVGIAPAHLALTAPASALAFTPDGLLLVAGDAGGGLHFWDMERQALIFSFAAHTSAVRALAFSPDGQALASVDDGGALLVWGVPPG
jgi:hypothetical protein